MLHDPPHQGVVGVQHRQRLVANLCGRRVCIRDPLDQRLLLISQHLGQRLRLLVEIRVVPVDLLLLGPGQRQPMPRALGRRRLLRAEVPPQRVRPGACDEDQSQ